MVDWGEAMKVFAVGFSGVFVCLIILMLSVMALGKIAALFTKKEKKEG
ncbi:MAG: OadG family protein [Syntrophales bacterium]|nr:OadG family protein [Syntrophales bacterium]